MARQTTVRYTTRDEQAAAENQRLIDAVFAEPAETRPDGLRYTVTRLDDGLSFVHVAVVTGESNPLLENAAFRAFSSTVGERAVEPPVAVSGEVVASFG
jgi:hypothetical protein